MSEHTSSTDPQRLAAGVAAEPTGTRETASPLLRALVLLADQLPALVVLLSASLALATWYGGRELVWGEDATHPLTLSEVSGYFHVPDAGLGAPDARKLPFILPLGALLTLLRWLGAPYDLVVVQPVVVVGLLTAAGWSSYLMVRTLLGRIGKLAALGGALLYMFNLYSLTTVWSSMSYLSFHYAFLPLVLTAWFVVLTRRVSLLLVPPAAALWALTLTPAYITTPIVVTDSLLFGAVTLFALVSARRVRPAAATVGRAALLYGTWLTLNLFWIVPVAAFAGAETARGLAAGDPLGLFAVNSAPFHEAIRLAGYWAVTSWYAGSPYFPWSAYYSDVGASAAYVLPLVAAVGLLFVFGRRSTLRERRGGLAAGDEPDARAHFTFFALLFVAALTLMTGVHAPFGGLKEWVVETVGAAGPFRSVYQRFGAYVALAYAPVFAVGLWALRHFLRARLGSLAAAGAVVAVGLFAAIVPALPLWTGGVFDQSGTHPSRRITIPDEYAELARILDELPGDYNVVVFPYGGATGVSVLTWDGGRQGYSGVDPLALLTRRPVLTGDATAPYLEELAKRVSLGGVGALEALRLLNARFVVLHDDLHRDFLQKRGGYVGIDVQNIDDRLEGLPGVHLVFAGEHLRAYSWTGWKPYRFFALREAELSASLEARARRAGETYLFDRSAFGGGVVRRPVPYRVDNIGRFVVDTSTLRPDELLVMNQPFDTAWRADGEQPVELRPGLTAFELDRGGDIVVTHAFEERFPALLAVAPVVLAGCAASFALALVRRARGRR